MKLIILMSSMLFVINTTVLDSVENLETHTEAASYLDMSECRLFYTIFETLDDLPIDIQDILVIELEEELELGFDTKAYLPQGFNPLKGKHDLDWSKIELVELEEELEFNFDTKDFLPKGFDPYHQMDRIATHFCKNK